MGHLGRRQWHWWLRLVMGQGSGSHLGPCSPKSGHQVAGNTHEQLRGLSRTKGRRSHQARAEGCHQGYTEPEWLKVLQWPGHHLS